MKFYVRVKYARDMMFYLRVKYARDMKIDLADRLGKIYFGITIGVMSPTLSFTGKIKFGLMHIF